MKSLANARVAACAALLATSGFATAASAQTETDPPPAIELSANVGVVSDYRFRGISYSGRDPAIQGGIDASHKSGLFVGTWASSVDNYGGSDAEIDLYGGFASSVRGLDYSVTALYYVYPNGVDTDYFELKGTVGKTIGPVTFEGQVAWVPDQNNYPGDNVYLGLSAETGIPNTPISVRGHIGRETGGYDKKLDWELGASYTFGVLTASLSYIDTNYSGIDEAGRAARGTVVASLLAQF